MKEYNSFKIGGAVFVFVFMLASTAQAITWTDANDGTGSGLDADLLDGLNSISFLRSDTSGAINGSLNVTGSIRGRNVTSGINPGHRHTGISVSDLTAASFTSANISQWNNDAGYFSVGTLSAPYLPYWNGSTLADSNIAVNSGNVGIGTTSPGATLDVNGTMTIANTGTFNQTGANNNAANFFNAGTDVIAAMFGNGSTSGFTADQYGGAVRFNGLGVAWGDLSYYPNGGGNGSQGNFRFSTTGGALNTSASGKLGVGELYSAGNVGIGTTSPSTALDVVGTVKVSGSDDATGGLDVYTGLLGTSAYQILKVDPNDDQLKANNLNIYTISGGMLTTTRNAFIDSSGNGYFAGNVGIGTAEPSEKLDIESGHIAMDSEYGLIWGSGADAEYMRRVASDSLAFGTQNTERIRIDSGGNVGIGTTTPGQKLEVAGNVYLNTIESDAQFTGGGLDLSGTYNRLRTDTSHDLNFDTYNGGTYKTPMTIQQNGNVGINTASPAQALDVTGYVRGSTGLCIGSDCRTSWPSSGSGTVTGTGTTNYLTKWSSSTAVGNSIIFDNGTYVGIGTSSPSSSLQVEGTIKANNFSGRDSTVTGGYANAFGNSTASGSYSTAMGHDTTASGNYSTSMGYDTTASGNGAVAMGYDTISSATDSTAMGYTTTASGNYSTSMGTMTTAQAYGSLVIGRYNEISGNSSSWVSTDPLFIIGNGTSTSAANNAFTVYQDGKIEVTGDITSDGEICIGSGC